MKTVVVIMVAAAFAWRKTEIFLHRLNRLITETTLIDVFDDSHIVNFNKKGFKVASITFINKSLLVELLKRENSASRTISELSTLHVDCEIKCYNLHLVADVARFPAGDAAAKPLEG